jgi:hypothetical protein
MSKIIIGRPYIEEYEDKVRLCSVIKDTEQNKSVLYYEVEKKYGKYLNDDRCDAFLVGLINSCMYNNEDIECEGQVSETLLFQLQTYYIPLISDTMSNMNCISVSADTTLVPVENAGGVGTGNSGGVDSTYTMLKYSRDAFKSYKLTHVLFTNISTNDTDDERIRRLFNKDIPLKKEAAEYLNIEFIALYTNLYRFYKKPGIFNHYFAQQYCSAPLALGKLFKTYYFSSTFKVNDFLMDEKKIVSSGRYDIFSLDTISLPWLKFYSAGMEVDRMDKLFYIENAEYTKKYLQVCSIEQSAGGDCHAAKLNCGYCNKCGRMIGIFYAQGILDEYADIFDLSFFYRNKARYIGQNLEADQGAFTKTVQALLKENNKYPLGINIWRWLYRMRYRLAKNEKLVAVYHKIKKQK